MILQAPAKLNLFLHVLARRDDGYHDLQTVFQFIDLCDELSFQLRDDGVIQRTGGLAGLAAADDLVVRAARALQQAAGVSAGAEINVIKRIPAGGGLGGGSSDAAAALVALARLWDIGWDRARLADLGVSLGADIPVFVHGHAAWAEGVGEWLTPVTLEEPWYLVVDPGVAVSTAAVFQAPELTRDSPRLTIRDFASGGGRNDFEPVVRARYPEVAAALDWLAGHGQARLTGTGGCVFAAFATQAAAGAVHAQLPRQWKGFVAKGLNRSPIIGA